MENELRDTDTPAPKVILHILAADSVAKRDRQKQTISKDQNIYAKPYLLWGEERYFSVIDAPT
jgi:hypothetical protein